MIITISNQELHSAVKEYFDRRGITVAPGSIEIQCYGDIHTAKAVTMEPDPKKVLGDFLTELTGIPPNLDNL